MLSFKIILIAIITLTGVASVNLQFAVYVCVSAAIREPIRRINIRKLNECV